MIKTLIKKGTLSHKEIRTILEQRYPFLLVDKIIELDDTTITGIKNVTGTEPYLVGHFPDDPIFPGVLLIEACSQVGGILMSRFYQGRGFIAQVDGFKFLSFIVPGETIKIVGNYKSHAGQFAKVFTEAFVDGKRVAKGEITYFFNS